MKLTAKGILVILVILAAAGLFGYNMLKPKAPEMPESPEVHIHPMVNIEVCGKAILLPKNTGTHELHTHDDVPRLHVEAPNIKLGDFFRIIKTRFNETCFGDYCNGDYCPLSQTPGKLKVYVNGTQNFEYERYEPKDWDDILIEFK